MVVLAQKERIYTIEEYLAFEEQSEVRHEFHNGKIRQMAGGTIAHNTIKKNKNNNLWEITEANALNESIVLHSIDFKLPLAAIYLRIPELLEGNWKG